MTITSKALARALFARCDIALLDDVFSALDGETETRAFRNLFGPTGLFRQLNTAVVLVTNSSKFPVLCINETTKAKACLADLGYDHV
jgi:ABC-type nitrate/sulfonate/bicarbonate transport system ATPase subunit